MTTLPVSPQATKTISMPRLFLQLEGLVILAATLILYANLDFKWVTFFLLLFVPDLPMVFYGINKRFASIAYNLVHTIIFPVILALFSYFYTNPLVLQVALIWLAHIGMDHVFGYGFKYLGSFKETHFSRI